MAGILCRWIRRPHLIRNLADQERTIMKNPITFTTHMLTLVAMFIMLILLSVSDFTWPSKPSEIVELKLPAVYLTGTDTACLLAAMEIEQLTRNGALVKLTNTEPWYPFKGQGLIDHRYVSRLINSTAAY
jgi:hypothetical protein